MRYAWGTSLLVLAAGLVLACDNDSPTSETAPPGGKPLAAIDNAPACLTTAAEAEQHAILYFQADPRLTEALIKIDLIAAECALLANGGSQGTIDSLGFQVLQLVSASREERASAAGADGWDGNHDVLREGSALTNSILSFMDVGYPPNISPAVGFEPALMTGGIYEVRGSQFGNDGEAATTIFGPFTWGAEPDETKGWTGSGIPLDANGMRDPSLTRAGVLIYGFAATKPAEGTETLVDRPGGEAAYSFNSLPRLEFDPEVQVGTCNLTDTRAVIQHKAGVDGLVVEYAHVPGFCNSDAFGAQQTGLTARLLRFAADLLATPLHAAAVAVGNTGGTSGAGSSFSDWFLVNLGAIQATVDSAQRDTKVGTALTLQLKVRGQQGTPVEEARVRFTIKTNRGQNATFCELPCDDRLNDAQDTVKVLTDESGAASLGDYGVAKTGGYRIEAVFEYPDPDHFPVDYSGSFVTPVFNVSK